MKEILEYIKKRVRYAATEAGGYRENIRVISEDEIEKILEDSEKKFNDGWIPVAERSPEKRGKYLVCSKGIIWVAEYFNYTWWGVEKRCRWGDIEAWMPLPDPYKREGGNHG